MKNSKEGSVARAKIARGHIAGDEVLNVNENGFCWESEAIAKIWAFTLSKNHDGV